MAFQVGNKFGQGRPKGSKNTLPVIRDKLFRILLRRIQHDNKLETVDTATLIKFCQACLPKDMSLSLNKDPNITYISNVPRPAITEANHPEVAKENNEYLCINQASDNDVNPAVDGDDDTQVVDTTIVKEVIASQ